MNFLPIYDASVTHQLPHWGTLELSKLWYSSLAKHTCLVALVCMSAAYGIFAVLQLPVWPL